MILTSMKIEDVNHLEQVFAVLKPDGWEIPAWLRTLRKEVQLNYILDPTAWMVKDSEVA